MEENELSKGIFALAEAAWVEADKALVIADLHLGIEEMLNRQGVMLPRFNFAQIKRRLEKRAFSRVKPELIVINGDLKHEFGSISEQEWSEVIDMLRFLQQHCSRIVLVKGNHDTILGPIAKWENIKIEEEGILLEKSRVFATHGSAIPKAGQYRKAKTVLIGHEHCAVTIREQYKQEQFKCFLVGKFNGKNLIAMPSMNTVSIGTDVRREQLLSPFLQQPLGRFRVFAVADKTYNFGKLPGLD
ncbi:MAG: metallophosphoesterase [Candidatus Diapherotrites archaeon]|uniref:Metallophosphoesterase n=1 Tax=Candidatus Iainarchaeum sp. TaxID=3101447 RepID=A0A938YQA0_9ARCH|nr:metallophosphoesterase [Candidatus Diapherotrites archaeon]